MPSNIALIKYMGKVKGAERNKPTNISLSYTLPHLRTRVELHPIAGTYDEWSPLESLISRGPQKPQESLWIPTTLSDRGRKRYLAHFGFLKQKLGVVGCYSVRSANNFPSDCGIASSASSFAALTQATYQLARTQNKKLDLSLEKVAELSRVGSGSSIRSFLSPFVVWSESGISTMPTPFSDLIHQVIVVDHEKKAIGSSDAHERVATSLLFLGRPERAEARMMQLQNAFQEGNWAAAFQVVWAEFWDMHALFSTSQPSFQYMNAGSLKVLEFILKYWEQKGDGPLVTMDAGANVHFLFRSDQAPMSQEVANAMRESFSVISSAGVHT